MFVLYIVAACFQDLLTRSVSRITMWTDEDLVEVCVRGSVDVYGGCLVGCGRMCELFALACGRLSLLAALIFHSMPSHSLPTISRCVVKKDSGLSKESNAGKVHAPYDNFCVLLPFKHG